MPRQADLYSNGVSEELIAKALATYAIPREGVVLMTKCRFATSAPGEPQLSSLAATRNDGRLVNRVGLSRKHILDAVEASVRRLGTYIDVLQIHRGDRDVPRDEIMKALHDVVERGWVRYIGASSVSHVSPSCRTTSTGCPDCSVQRRCPHGNSKPFKTLPRAMACTSSSRCKTTTTCCIGRKSAR